MGKLCQPLILRSLRSISTRFSSAQHISHGSRHSLTPSFRHCNRSFFSLSPKRFSSDYKIPYAIHIGSTRRFSEDVTHILKFTDADIENAFKNLMVASWVKLPDVVKKDAKSALSKQTNDEAGHNFLDNALNFAENCERLCKILAYLAGFIDVYSIFVEVKSVVDDDKFTKYASGTVAALLHAVQDAYKSMLDEQTLNGFENDGLKDELRKKIETEFGTKWKVLKMSLCRLGFDWEKFEPARDVFEKEVLNKLDTELVTRQKDLKMMCTCLGYDWEEALQVLKYASRVLADILHETQDGYKSILEQLALDEDGAIKNELRKKIETELGTKWTSLKTKCSSLGLDWEKLQCELDPDGSVDEVRKKLETELKMKCTGLGYDWEKVKDSATSGFSDDQIAPKLDLCLKFMSSEDPESKPK